MTTIAELLDAAAPGPKPLADLVARLTAERLLRTVVPGPEGRTAADATAIHDVTDDSRAVRPGTLFVAIRGLHVDGHEFVEAAAAEGASAAIVETPRRSVAIPQLVVEGSQGSLAAAAAWLYGDPSRELGIIGITGTDGKTTTSFLAAAALEAAGLRTGLLGTAELRIGGTREANPEHVTTPGAPALQRTLAAMGRAGDEAVVLETTSHGLALGRVGAIAYDAAILTNVTHEHLEFHGTWEAYRDAKLSLFERLASGPRNPTKRVKGQQWSKAGVINADDPSADLFSAVTREAGARLVTYGTDERATVRATRVEDDARRLRVAYEAPSGAARLELQLAGRFNAHNALAVVALGEVLGLDAAAVRAGLEGVAGVPGRMERIDEGQPFGVVVDYAHSPAALTNVLDLLAPLAAARGGTLVTLFGSAGERDTAKRPQMGRIAGERSRIVVVTDEDPRGEDRVAIIEDIAAGAESAGRHRGSDLLLIPDRREAIEAAIERARPGDIVLLAGKGHEQTILYADGPIAWNEAGVARAILRDMGFQGSAA